MVHEIASPFGARDIESWKCPLRVAVEVNDMMEKVKVCLFGEDIKALLLSAQTKSVRQQNCFDQQLSIVLVSLVLLSMHTFIVSLKINACLQLLLFRCENQLLFLGWSCLGLLRPIVDFGVSWHVWLGIEVHLDRCIIWRLSS